jgi:hypothetical protein
VVPRNVGTFDIGCLSLQAPPKWWLRISREQSFGQRMKRNAGKTRKICLG